MTPTSTITPTPTPTMTPLPLAAGAVTIHCTYDALNRLTCANYGNRIYFNYTYDVVENRLTQTKKDGTITSAYDDANRLASVNGTVYSWDANVNLLNDGASTYAYTNNKLSSVTTGGVTYQYVYNGDGNRVAQMVGGVTTRYTLDMAGGLTQVLADGANTYLYGDERIAQYAKVGRLTSWGML